MDLGLYAKTKSSNDDGSCLINKAKYGHNLTTKIATHIKNTSLTVMDPHHLKVQEGRRISV